LNPRFGGIKRQIMEMRAEEKLLSVSQAATLCGVGHSTVGYWVRGNKLHAHRVGNQYSIPVEELVLYLKSKGQEIPDELAGVDAQLPDIRALPNCWQYLKDTSDGHNCNNCLVFKNRVETCFTGKGVGSLECSTECLDCKYYLETYLLRIQFIHQILSPAAVLKDFHIWGGNNRWAELCGVDERDLPGMGVEQIFHSDSLERVIVDIKKRVMGDPSVSGTYRAFFKNAEKGKIGVRISVYGLDDPAEALLFLAEPERKESRRM